MSCGFLSRQSSAPCTCRPPRGGMAYVGLIWDGKLDEAHGGGGPDDHVRTLICSWSSGPPPPCASSKPGVCNNQVCVLIRSVC